jgi:UDP-3-O-[3-hydroxymyristoyl] glucosamine N-acyltransferase
VVSSEAYSGMPWRKLICRRFLIRFSQHSIDEMITLETLAAKLNLELRNPAPQAEITHVSSIASSRPGSLVFATDAPSAASAIKSTATAVILPKDIVDESAPKPTLLSVNPKLDFARAAQLLRIDQKPTGIHPTAVVDSTASLADTASIAATAVIAAHATLGEHTIIGEGAVIGEGVTIGADCHIYPRVVIYPGTTLGDRVIVHAGAVLGSDGFGYVSDPATGRYIQFPQQGTLVLEDDVEIGANTAIDRGALAETRICRGTKIDNLVHVGHNVRIGHDTVIAALTGISGSCTVGNNVMLGGQVGMGDHAHIGDGVVLGGQGGVLPGKTLNGPGVVFWGTPAQPLKHILKELSLLRRLRRRSEGDG